MPSSVVTDLVANDKVTAAVNKAASGLKRYASEAKAALAGVADKFRHLGSSIPGVNRLTTALGAAGLVGALAKATQLAKVQEDAERKLAAVLKATGGAAGLSADQIKKFAAARQNLTNFGDEATIAVASVLATFREIKGDVFKDALVAIQDMSTILGTDMKGSAIQLGKALNDPIAGIAALTRSGVSFTEQQKAQIKAMQESGNVLGAQKIILAELKAEFGGAAEAMADPMVQFKNALGDLGEQIGSQLMPFVRVLATDLKDGLDSSAASASGVNVQLGIMGESIIAITDFVHGFRDGFLEAYLVILKAVTGYVLLNNQLAKMLPKGSMGRINAEEAVIAYTAQIRAIEKVLAEKGDKGTWGEQLRERVLKIRAEMDKLREAAAGKGGGAGGGVGGGPIEELQKQVDVLRKSLATPMESAQSEFLRLTELWIKGALDAENYGRAVTKLKADLASGFGPLLSEGSQAKLDAKFAEIEKNFQQRFGREMTSWGATVERHARRKTAIREALGLEKTPQEQFRESMERAGVARGVGDMDAYNQIRQEAEAKLQESIRQRERTKAGLGGFDEELMTNAEKLKASLQAIKGSYEAGGYGAKETAGATETMRRQVAAAMEQYGKQAPEVMQPRFEGLQDTWRRIQESAAGRSNDPQERAARAAEANKDQLAAIGSNTKEFVDWLKKLYEKKDDKTARAG